MGVMFLVQILIYICPIESSIDLLFPELDIDLHTYPTVKEEIDIHTVLVYILESDIVIHILESDFDLRILVSDIKRYIS